MFIKLELPIKLTEEDNCFIAICPVFNVGSQGKTQEEALKNAKEALELFLEDADVQEEFAEIILEYTVSLNLMDEEKEFNPVHLGPINSEFFVGVQIHGA